MECDRYEVLRERDGLSVVILLRFAAWKGSIVEFFLASEHGASQVAVPAKLSNLLFTSTSIIQTTKI